ncbi:PTS system, cellobiose-specific IIA component [Spiroplasma litorale]|uniref:PTS system, cellobiose-specific IIA component n=1 Tax=Spiroplasma litorale TaxID=216942 RepID=A0A0K1W297_9MOLU|nr:PTS lactose/cellobiose transporter subunit IIA [Spiroplasma litorale]AKX34227.1 PTS system, cellobiose-specific IIA component [Spiroplasma litorale]
MKQINWEEISMNIISLVGEAKSNAIIAIDEAENFKFDIAEKLIEDAENLMIEAEQEHMEVISQEANGIDHPFKLLFVHAEDQMLSTQTLIIMAKKFIKVYKLISKK